MKRIITLSLLFSFLFQFGKAQFVSQNISLLNNWSDPAVVPEPGYGIKYNGIWGWAGNGREYAIIGSTAGVYFIDVTNPTAPVEVDYVAGKRDSCIWREIKTYDHYAYLVSDDGSPNSFQIVDLQYLPDSVHVVADYSSLFERSHTIFVDGNKLYSGITRGGSFTSQVAMSVFSLSNPESPTFLRSLNDDFPSLLSYNQVHDMYVRNDTIYASCAFDGLFIFKYDSITNQFLQLASLTTYFDQGYNHSSALTDDSRTLIFTDEVPIAKTVKVLDVSDLQNLSVVANFQSNIGPTAHNPFIVGNTCYIAYYQDGIQVYDVSIPANPVRIGYFDTHNQTALGGPYPSPSYQGAWGAYPYLPSGHILVSDMQNGLFVLDASSIQSIQELDRKNDIVVYPNPATNTEIIRIKSSIFNGENCLLTIKDITGRNIKSINITNTEVIDVDITDLSKGVFVISIESGSTVASKKLVVQ